MSSSIDELLRRAELAGVLLERTPEGGLRISYPPGFKGAQLRAELRQHRDELLELLDRPRAIPEYPVPQPGDDGYDEHLLDHYDWGEPSTEPPGEGELGPHGLRGHKALTIRTFVIGPSGLVLERLEGAEGVCYEFWPFEPVESDGEPLSELLWRASDAGVRLLASPEELLVDIPIPSNSVSELLPAIGARRDELLKALSPVGG